MSRIKLTDNTMGAVMKMADGNPGAIQAMIELLKNADRIDPQGVMGGLGAILMLDTLEIYGTEIYILFNDQCNRDIRLFLMLIRAWQLGFILDSLLKSIATCQTRENLLSEKEMEELDKKVCEKLNTFEKPKKLCKEA